MGDDIHILHVDDDPDFADTTALYLEQEDERFDIDVVTSGADGLDRLTKEIDCIISDYDMPGMNGIEFIATVRETYPDLPCILFTGKGSEAVASDAISAGVTDYLRKRTGNELYEILANRIRTAVGQYRAERELERQNDLFERAQDLADVGAWEYNVADEHIYFTQQVYDIYGVESDYEPSPQKDIKNFYHPDDREMVRDAVERALEAGQEYDIEARITAADGTKKWIRTLADPTFVDGSCQRVRGTIWDVTERKEREQELERQNARLDEFVSVVSHDLRSPLHILSTSLDLLTTDEEGVIERCRRSVVRMESLIDDLLTLARHGETGSAQVPVSLDAVARECAQTAIPSTEALSIETDATVLADEGRLKQLLENLFSNAVEHSQTDVSITVGSIDGGFYVADNGEGIPEDEREQIFEAGYSTSTTGTGFGLNIVKQVVASHGWTIDVTESRERGARFEITGVEYAS